MFADLPVGAFQAAQQAVVDERLQGIEDISGLAAGHGFDSLGARESDVILPVVPMFHANAWGLPYACALSGASQVFPGPEIS